MSELAVDDREKPGFNKDGSKKGLTKLTLISSIHEVATCTSPSNCIIVVIMCIAIQHNNSATDYAYEAEDSPITIQLGHWSQMNTKLHVNMMRIDNTLSSHNLNIWENKMRSLLCKITCNKAGFTTMYMYFTAMEHTHCCNLTVAAPPSDTPLN